MSAPDLQELYHKFDGADDGANTRLAWYGQERASGLNHSEAIAATAVRFSMWCHEWWPRRGIPLQVEGTKK